jgi:hypothetical protein
MEEEGRERKKRNREKEENVRKQKEECATLRQTVFVWKFI